MLLPSINYMNQDQLIEELKKLGTLYKSGVLSETEFDELKQTLLAQLSEPNTSREINKEAVKIEENSNSSKPLVNDPITPKKRSYIKIIVIGIGVLIVITLAFLVFRSFIKNTSHEVSLESDSLPSAVEAVEVLESEEANGISEEKVDTETSFFFEGPYSIFGLSGRAKYSYRIDDACNTLLEGPFEFEEGFYEEDGSFNGMGSGVAHIAGQFKNNKQEGEWSIGTGHYGIELGFKDGVPNGKFTWSFGGRFEVGECKGTYKNGKLVGNFICEYTDGDIETYIKGVFNSNGKPTGIWEEKRSDGDMRWYVMDKATANEKGVQGSFDGEYMYHENLDLRNRMLDISEFVLSKKVTKQNIEYPTYWEN